MTITPDQAKALIDGATDGPWGLLYRDTHPNAVPTNIEADGYCLATYDDGYGGDPEWNNPGGDLPLLAAAPDLARTVIEQAEEIERKRQANNTLCHIIASTTRDLAKAIGREELLDEYGDRNQDIHEIALDMIAEARAAREVDQ